MQAIGPIWKRALDSVKRVMSQPIGGARRIAPPVMRRSEAAEPPPPAKVEARSSPQPVPVSRGRSHQVSGAATPASSAAPSVPHAPPTPPPPTSRRLWGREFTTSADGLDEAQVVEFVNSQLARYEALYKQQGQLLSLGSLSEKAAIEADKAAEAIKARSRSRAEAESSRVIAEAHQKSQQMLTEAKAAAREATRPEVERVLAMARQRSAIMQEDAKRQSQMFLIKSRESVAEDLQHEVQQCCNKLLMTLQQLDKEGHRLESQWKDRTAEVCGSEVFELEPGEGTHTEFVGEAPISSWSFTGEQPSPEDQQLFPPHSGAAGEDFGAAHELIDR